MNSFDERASTWDDDPAKIERADVVADVIRETIELTRSQRVLEYGAGTGLVSQALQGHVGPITLVDTSAGMRDVMTAKIAAGDLAGARVWDLDLSTSPALDERFDLVVTVLTLHHVDAVATVLERFATLLDDGGHLCIVDLDKEDGSFHGPDFHGHHGFARPELTKSLKSAGFVDIEFRPCHHIVRDTGTFPMFLATARTAQR